MVCDINKNLRDDFRSAHSERTLVLDTDITNDSALDDMFEQGEKMFGPIDAVVNSAGMMDKFDPPGDMDRIMWDRVIALNLTAPAMGQFSANLHVLPLLRGWILKMRQAYTTILTLLQSQSVR